MTDTPEHPTGAVGEMFGSAPAGLREHALHLARETNTLHRNLVERRRTSGLTAADVAERLGVTEEWVAGFEHYDANPTLSQIRRYALATGARLQLRVLP